MSTIVNKRQAITVATVALVLASLLTMVWLFANSKQSVDVSYDNVVTLDVDHPTYSNLDEMKSDAEYIFAGKVEGSGRPSLENARPKDDLTDPSPFTEYTIKVEDVYKGSISDKSITFRQLGGVSDKTLYEVEDYPVLKPGERYVFFAIKGDDGKYGALAGGYAVADIKDSKFKVPERTGLKNADFDLSTVE